MDISSELLHDDSFYPVLGHFLGRVADDKIAVIEGLPQDTTLDQLKALGAASASSGAVGLFHAVGVTPEAATREAAFQGRAPERVIEVHRSDLCQSPLGAVHHDGGHSTGRSHRRLSSFLLWRVSAIGSADSPAARTDAGSGCCVPGHDEQGCSVPSGA